MASLFLVERRQVPRLTPDTPPDADQREQALDIRRSWIVEAPAGSGKTGLLIQRLLKLLADDSVTEPEQVLAITFTVKATGELRERVLTQLEAAALAAPVHSKFDRETRELASAVLRRDATLGWHLLEDPSRLRIRTIDAVCAEIARSLPVLSGSGGQLATVPDAQPLYQEAARRTFLQLGGSDEPLDQALRTILLHRDGNLADCERLLVGMLALRDQWGTLVPLTGAALTDVELESTVLPKLERALDQAICAGLQQLANTIPADILEALTGIASELGHMAGYQGTASPFALCANLRKAPGETADHLAHWKSLIHLLATGSTGWRKERGINKKTIGVHEYNRKSPYHGVLSDILEAWSKRDDLLSAFSKVRNLPPAKYPPDQWHVAKALFRILHHALVELQLVFATRGECDFTELGLLARAALRRDTEGDDLAAAFGLRLQHLLLDEMQDTSTSQYDLVELLTHGWDGASQTVFLVGDPKQSIYLFRQARVERFVRAMRTGRLGELPLGTLRLTANFRSQSALVEEANEDFSRLFPQEVTPLHPEDVPFVAAIPVREPTGTEAREWHAVVLPEDSDPGERQRQSRGEALAIRHLVEQWHARPLPPGRTKPWSIAVLVRARQHLKEIVAEFKRSTGTAPISYRAVDIDPLGERREILDLLALTRALLHPGDRVAWLAILRAPWCGLTLTDLHTVAAGDDRAHIDALLPALIAERTALLSPDGQQRLARLGLVMQAAESQRGKLPLAQWVDRTWRALGGPLFLLPEELANTARLFPILDELEHGDADLAQALEQRLKTLYADSPPQPGAVDLLTIHKAKGLEWDVVLIPGLERKSRVSRAQLLTWTELDSLDPESAHVILAPIVGRGEPSRELNDWIKSLENAREAAERKRLLYVACTRAREELHLFAALEASSTGELNPASGSLLQAAWPAAFDLFDSPDRSSQPLSPIVPIRPEPLLVDLAAAAEPAPEPPPRLHRLPGNFDVQAYLMSSPPLSRLSSPSLARREGQSFVRPEGSFAARAFGNTVHAFLELVALRLAQGASPDALLGELPAWAPRIGKVLCAESLPPAQRERLTQRVLSALTNTLTDATGRWMLAPHPGASSEHTLTTWRDERSSIRLDRTFRAGPTPSAPGETHLWIVDFKTATHGREGLETFLEQQRAAYEPQLQAYASALAPKELVCLMLYYPLLSAHIWWPAETLDR